MARRINFGESESDARFAIEDNSDTGGDLRILDVSGSSPVEIAIYDYSQSRWVWKDEVVAESSFTDAGGVNHTGELADLVDLVDVSDDGTLTVENTSDINFASNLTVTDDADGSVTIDATDTDTRINLSNDGTQVLAEPTDVDFKAEFDVTDDTDGTASVNLTNVASGSVTLSSGTATVNTGITATGATFYLALGVDDPDADTNLAGKLFWDDSAGSYKVTIDEIETSVGNPTANYDILRVR